MPAELKKNSPINTLTEHLTLTFHNSGWKKLLLELRGVVAIIMSNADKLENCPFAKFIWEQHHHLESVATVRFIY